MGFRSDPSGAGLVRRRQVGGLPPLGPVLGAGLGAAGARHPGDAGQERPQTHAAGEPLRRVVPQHHAGAGQPDAAAPPRGLRGQLPLRQFRQDLQRRLQGRQPRCAGRLVPGGRGPLRGADEQAPRGLRALAFVGAAPRQGCLPRRARPGGRPERGRARPADADGAVLLGRVRLALQRRGADPGVRCRAGRAAGPAVSRVRDGAGTGADRHLRRRPSSGTTSRGPRAATWPSCLPTTTTPSTTA